MADHLDREYYIPLRQQDLVEFLCQNECSAEEAGLVRSLATALSSHYHHEFHTTLTRLKEDYAWFDPDNEAVTTRLIPELERERRLDDFYEQMNALMRKANFERVTQEQIELALTQHSEWGSRMTVDFSIFDRIALYVRGEGEGFRFRKTWRNLWRPEKVPIPIYRRLVVILKLQENARLKLGEQVDSADIYMKLFKDIPQADLEMLLPGAKLQMTRMDKGKVTFPIITGLLIALWNILQPLLASLLKIIGTATVSLASPISMWGLAVATGSYGYKSLRSYGVMKNQYTLKLTRSLYYQNLDNNAGVIHRLLDEAEEQENREAFLGYFFLLKFAPFGGWTSEELDDAIESYLETKLHLKVDFEICDALWKLQKLGLVQQLFEGRYSAVPLREALFKLQPHPSAGYRKFA